MPRTAGGHREERTSLREKMPKAKKFGGRKKRRRWGAKTVWETLARSRKKRAPVTYKERVLNKTSLKPGLHLSHWTLPFFKLWSWEPLWTTPAPKSHLPGRTLWSQPWKQVCLLIPGTPSINSPKGVYIPPPAPPIFLLNGQCPKQRIRLPG